MEFNFQILGKLADKIRHNSSAVEWLKEPPDYPDLPKYSGSCWQKMGQLRNLYTHTLYSTNANTSPRSSLRRELGNISSTLLEGCVIGSSWMNQYLLSRFRNAAYHLNYERVEVAKIELARALDHFENHGLTQSSLLPFNRAYRLLSLSSQKRRSREPDSMMFCLGQIGTALRILKTVPLQNATARQIARAKRLQKQWLTELKEKLVIRPGEWPLQVYNGMSRELAKRTR